MTWFIKKLHPYFWLILLHLGLPKVGISKCVLIAVVFGINPTGNAGWKLAIVKDAAEHNYYFPSALKGCFFSVCIT